MKCTVSSVSSQTGEKCEVDLYFPLQQVRPTYQTGNWVAIELLVLIGYHVNHSYVLICIMAYFSGKTH